MGGDPVLRIDGGQVVVAAALDGAEVDGRACHRRDGAPRRLRNGCSGLAATDRLRTWADDRREPAPAGGADHDDRAVSRRGRGRGAARRHGSRAGGDDRGGHGERAARQGRRRVPDRRQVGVGPRRRRRDALRRRQRRRGRAGDVQGPHADARRPVPDRRGSRHRRLLPSTLRPPTSASSGRSPSRPPTCAAPPSSSAMPDCSGNWRSRSSRDPTSTCSARRRRCSR